MKFELAVIVETEGDADAWRRRVNDMLGEIVAEKQRLNPRGWSDSIEASFETIMLDIGAELGANVRFEQGDAAVPTVVFDFVSRSLMASLA